MGCLMLTVARGQVRERIIDNLVDSGLGVLAFSVVDLIVDFGWGVVGVQGRGRKITGVVMQARDGSVWCAGDDATWSPTYVPPGVVVGA